MKNNDIAADLFIKNRFKLSSKLKPGSCLVLYGADEMPRNGDQFYPFRQNSDFFYLTGIEQEESTLILAPDHKDPKMREILVILKPTPELETWNGKKLSPEEAEEISGISRVIFQDAFDSIMADILPRIENIYLNQPQMPKFFPEVESRDERLGRKLRDSYPLYNFFNIAPGLRELRETKEKAEIDRLRKAVNITHKGFDRILKTMRPGMNEKEIEAGLHHEFLINGARGFSFPPIVASGLNACYLHYTDNKKIIEEGELVLMDFGAEYQNYAADISRTIPASGRFSPRQAELYDGLLEVFYKTREMMKPGLKMEDVHNQVCEWMKTFHASVGLYSKEDLEKTSDGKSLYFQYYMHGTGHSVGLDVHDNYDKTGPLRPGMVFTCEPGIYIQDEKIGIRIENNLLITETGNIDLSEDIAIERKDIEKLMQTKKK
jgi:Xaa-Pro aminopeptidase